MSQTPYGWQPDPGHPETFWFAVIIFGGLFGAAELLNWLGY